MKASAASTRQEFRDALTYYTNLYLVDKVSPPDTPTYGDTQVQNLFTGRQVGHARHRPLGL